MDNIILPLPYQQNNPHLQSQSRKLVRTIKSRVGSDIQDINLAGIGGKQIGHSSLAGKSLNGISSRSARLLFELAIFFMPLPMIHLARVALQYLTLIHDLHILRLAPPLPPCHTRRNSCDASYE